MPSSVDFAVSAAEAIEERESAPAIAAEAVFSMLAAAALAAPPISRRLSEAERTPLTSLLASSKTIEKLRFSSARAASPPLARLLCRFLAFQPEGHRALYVEDQL